MSAIERFRPLLARIAEGAAARERDRVLPRAEIRALVDAGFGALRVPAELGGGGIGLAELFDLLIELAAADPNIPQALRGHLGFVEKQLVLAAHSPEPERARQWLRRVADGLTVGNSQAEAGPATAITTRVTRESGKWVFSGRKSYTTGTLYSDATWSSGLDPDGRVLGLVVPTDVDEVEVIDDWTGFGQRLTGSGTTVFDDVVLSDDAVYRLDEEPAWFAVDYRIFLHLLLQATMAGIAVGALAESVEFVRGRSRSFGILGETSPRADPRVQGVVGELSSRTAAASAIVRDVARDYERTRAHMGGLDSDAERYEEAVRVQIRQFEAQQVVIDQVLAVTTRLFEVGGASAVLAEKGLDRHWRNARTIASHNPAVFRQAAIGDWLLNGTAPERAMR